MDQFDDVQSVLSRHSHRFEIVHVRSGIFWISERTSVKDQLIRWLPEPQILKYIFETRHIVTLALLALSRHKPVLDPQLVYIEASELSEYHFEVKVHASRPVLLPFQFLWR